MTLLLDAPVKVCGMCRETKPLDAFYADKSRSTGRQRQCKDCQKDRVRQHHIEHRPERLEKMREHGTTRVRVLTPEIRETNAEWRRRNRSRLTEMEARRRAAKVAVAYVVTERDWSRLVARHQGLCAYCRTQPWEHRDHVVPLSRGGQHAIGNLLPACGHCNTSKRDRLLTEWRR